MKNYYADIAIKEAEKSTMSRGKHGACVVLRGKVIAVGHNRKFINGPDKRRVLSLHAEMDAMRKCSPKDLRKAQLYVVRKNFGNSKPCKACQKAINRFGVTKIFYSEK